MYLLGEALEELLHVRGQVSVQAAEGLQHAPEQLQGQSVEHGQLVKEQRVDGPEGGDITSAHWTQGRYCTGAAASHCKGTPESYNAFPSWLTVCRLCFLFLHITEQNQ